MIDPCQLMCEGKLPFGLQQHSSVPGQCWFVSEKSGGFLSPYFSIFLVSREIPQLLKQNIHSTLCKYWQIYDIFLLVGNKMISKKAFTVDLVG